MPRALACGAKQNPKASKRLRYRRIVRATRGTRLVASCENSRASASAVTVPWGRISRSRMVSATYKLCTIWSRAWGGSRCGGAIVCSCGTFRGCRVPVARILLRCRVEALRQFLAERERCEDFHRTAPAQDPAQDLEC